MRLLVLGGTRFVGRHLVEAALTRGHQVTLFNRGRSHPGLFPEAEELHGDRMSDLSALDGRRWDAVLDVNGYVPRSVRASAGKLAGAVDLYVFISTISVYAHLEEPGVSEESPVQEPPPGGEDAEEVTNESYGWLKALCERAAEEAMPGRVLHVRPGIQSGPHDYTGRFAWWVTRVALGGEVLAPGRPESPIQAVDARDLATWVVRMTEERATGVYNVTGPEPPLTMEGMLAACREASGSDAVFTWVGDTFLAEHGIELPLWLTCEEEGFGRVISARARARGLTLRPVEETARDVLAWVAEDPEHRTPERLAPAREAGLLREWHRQRRGGQG
ncbi:MAG TPA: NAD-dependent epimerase/dehydratase family protein [Thermoanaerobaculia bacterium]|nr:NAD-dependent epimerase/dehydratase family protein [Thermoanaerobaculia bacterium]